MVLALRGTGLLLEYCVLTVCDCVYFVLVYDRQGRLVCGGVNLDHIDEPLHVWKATASTYQVLSLLLLVLTTTQYT
jgi:hypothetical protein